MGTLILSLFWPPIHSAGSNVNCMSGPGPSNMSLAMISCCGKMKNYNQIHVQGFVFDDDSDRIDGACAFRDRTETSDTQLWGLQWIWICPTERHKGHLAARWEML